VEKWEEEIIEEAEKVSQEKPLEKEVKKPTAPKGPDMDVIEGVDVVEDIPEGQESEYGI